MIVIKPCYTMFGIQKRILHRSIDIYKKYKYIDMVRQIVIRNQRDCLGHERKGEIILKRTVLTIGTIAVVTLGSTIFADTSVYAEKSLDDINSERQEIKSKLSKAESEIADVLYEIKDINDKLARVEDSIKENQQQLDKAEKKIGKYEDEIAELQEEIDALNKKIEERNDILKTRISSYQDNGGNIQYLEVFLGAKDFSEFVSRLSAVSTITKSDMKLLEEQEADKQAVEDKQDEVNDKLDEQKDMKSELKAIEETMEEQKSEVEADKDKLKKKEANLKDKKSKLENEDGDLAALESDIRASFVTTEETSVASETVDSSESNSGSSSNASSNNDSGSSKASKPATQNVAYTGGGGSAISAGKQFIGNSTYVFGARNPNTGQFDCSGFVQWAYKQEGVSLPGATGGQAGTGTKISYSQAKPGDLVFFDTYKTNGHVGIYLGGGQFLGSQSSTGVAIANMNSGYWADHFNGHVRRVK